MKNKFNRVVFKLGSSTLTYENGKPNLRFIDGFCKVCSDLANRGVSLVIVSSGAQAMGVGRLGYSKKPESIPDRQATAAVGQVQLMSLYDKMFSEYGKTAAQLLLTRDVIDNPERLQNVSNTFGALLDKGIIPIVNENDTISTEELGFSENDTLSAIVAEIVGADLLILLSDIDGLYDKNPAEHRDAKIISRVEKIDDAIRLAAGGTGSARGSGGMSAKIAAAELAGENGINMLIINGSRPENIFDIFDGKVIGTLFCSGKVEGK